MTQEQNELLLKDLCSRLPYGVKLQHVKNVDSIVELYSIDLDDFYCKIQFYTYKGKVLTASDEGKLLKPGGMPRYKPYLFPMSSLSSNHIFEIKDILGEDFEIDKCGITDLIRGRCTSLSYLELDVLFEYFNKNHFDYRNLIPMGLALDATNLNVY